ncbi:MULTISPECIES: DNA mismatch repair protein MutS [unclassified Exiguobacterium]|uniref:DNA mismatch repair protein MutS n=3 Tax=Exiguobacterium TaxID=33986 RepID=UPI002881A3C1|nr:MULTISPECIES: DNA mismatch repair protein MutS [unclassified Exiguobacterium]MDT0171724.1 DNA mismatch repair protein MutS [Exiguobacterium sp. BRG2]
MEAVHNTPMMKQYFSIKADYPDAFLFYRLGDFYELFFEDAKKVAHELELTLTAKNGKNAEHPIPMCGVPHHAANGYIEQLIERGYKVALCDQVEDPKLTKGLVKREVIQVITPGTLMSALTEKENRYLVAVVEQDGRFGIARGDVSTGESALTSVATLDGVIKELSIILPREIIVTTEEHETALASLRIPLTRSSRRETHPHGDRAIDTAQAEAFAVLYAYMHDTQKRALTHLQPAVVYEASDFMQLEPNTVKNLELVRSARTGDKKGSLLGLLDVTGTAMGGRMLKRWLEKPLLSERVITERLDAVEELLQHYFERQQLKDTLREVYDLERLVAKVGYGTASARDLVQLKSTLRLIPRIQSALEEMMSERLGQLSLGLDPHDELSDLLDRAFVEAPPISTREGGMIKSGYSPDLDELLVASKDGKTWLATLEANERAATGIKTLKIGYNRVFGYYIEVSRANAKLLPEGRYERKQTLANAERYITPELKEKEALILGAEEKSVTLEYDLFCGVRDEVKGHIESLQRVSRRIAELDVLVALAEIAETHDYVRPITTTGRTVDIQQGRHPVIETVLPRGEYVANGITLNEGREMLLITGPNMSGKSTYMRQFALISLLHQIGSFVPAAQAELPIFDQIFTRIGAADDLVSGQSTFMVEMVETQEALTRATDRSLILLDEIGRGTSTYDGMALAQAIVEHIARHVGAKTLFSTHYHELTVLEESIDRLANVHVRAVEQEGRVVFLHEVRDGKADQSYGIHVARLADLPDSLIERAQVLLSEFEQAEPVPVAAPVKAPVQEEPIDQLSLFSEADPLRETMASLDLINMTPLEALNTLYRLQAEARK